MRKKILEILKEIKPEYDFSGSLNFVEEGILDSFDIVDLVTALDKEYQISIEGEDISPANFRNLDDICSLLKKNGVKP